jgi:hypothetical protein
MHAASQTVSKSALWTGRVISTIVILFMLMDAGMKVVKVPMVVQESAKVGMSETAVQAIGFVLLVSTVLYAIPMTAILGAILLTGYLGGAIATNVAFHTGWFPIVFALAFGVLGWLGLFARDAELRGLIPVRVR